MTEGQRDRGKGITHRHRQGCRVQRGWGGGGEAYTEWERGDGGWGGGKEEGGRKKHEETSKPADKNVHKCERERKTDNKGNIVSGFQGPAVRQ